MITPTATRPIVDPGGEMSQQFRTWTQEVTKLDIIPGIGSPEGVVEALQRQLYMDTAGTAGNILYIKRDADIGGDKTQGWVLV